MKIAFVYDWFDTNIGGAERLIQVLHNVYPQAPWYTSHANLRSAIWAKGYDIRTSFLQKFPPWFRSNRLLTLPFLPLAFESFDLSEYDTVISVSSAFAKNVITSRNTKHICYLLTPPRWLWNMEKQKTESKVQNVLDAIFGWYIRHLDKIGAQRVDEFVSISNEVAKRCLDFYSRESGVIYPPVDYDYWAKMSGDVSGSEIVIQGVNLEPKSYFLTVSRLEPYKRVDLAMRSFAIHKNKKPDVKLVIVGIGSMYKKLVELSRNLNLEPNVIWFSSLEDMDLARLYTHAVALIMPQREDFGYTACEAVACSCPAVVYRWGGQTEIIKDGVNGIYFDSQDPKSLALGLEEVCSFKYNQGSYENSNIRGWGRDSFVASISQKIPKTV